MERRYKLSWPPSACATPPVSEGQGRRGRRPATARSGFRPDASQPRVAEPLQPLPYIVVIDEFADMMMIVGKGCRGTDRAAEASARGRRAPDPRHAAPSVDVINGSIKANIPTRIAFQVSSKIDSRNHFDQVRNCRQHQAASASRACIAPSSTTKYRRRVVKGARPNTSRGRAGVTARHCGHQRNNAADASEGEAAKTRSLRPRHRDRHQVAPRRSPACSATCASVARAARSSSR